MKGNYLRATRIILALYVLFLGIATWSYWPIATRFLNGSATVGDFFDTLCGIVGLVGSFLAMLLLLANLKGLSRIAESWKKQAQA